MPLQATSGAASYDAFGGGVPAVPNYIEDVFSTYLYTGNNSTNAITNGIDLAGKGGMVWIKSRTSAAGHALWDTARTPYYYLVSNATSAEQSVGSSNALTSYNADGFTVTGGSNAWNGSQNYASWTFRKQPKFFDVVTYTGNNSSPRAIAHNLGSTPGCMIVKNTSTGGAWYVYHRSSAASGFTPQECILNLNNTNAVTDNTTFWASTAPTSTVFTVGSSLNSSGETYVAYLFAHNAGGFGLTGTDNVISCGSATATVGTWTDVNVGFEPQWVLIKNSTATGSYNPSGSAGSQDWYVIDTMRGATAATGSNTSTVALSANSSIAEYNDVWFGLTSTGFSFKGVTGGSDNFIYIAIRRGPMKVPTSGTSVLQTLTYTGNGSSGRIYSGVTTVPDLAIATSRSNTSPKNWCDRLRGENPMISTSTDGESGTSQEGKTIIAGSANGTVTFGSYWGDAAVNTNGYTYVNYLLSRAPSFFDEVCYTGTGTSNTAIAHNLGVIPELWIVKARNEGTRNWQVYYGLGSSSYSRLVLNTTGAATTGIGYNAGTNLYAQPTATNLYLDSAFPNTTAETYVTYLFATCAGVSKVGTYTGTGATQTIDCGFTGGARFVLIKRTDSTGDWYVWDSARGIVAGNDPYLLLNSTAAEVTNTDYVDTYSAGFEISSTAPAAINASGGTFIFLAIA